MNAALMFFGLLWALMGGGKRSAPAPAPAAQRPPSTPPWPAMRPSGLPPFPGRGWEYDEPPPRAVQVRAGELRAQLWARGKGSHITEQTGGRWIVYRAEITRGGKQGVVAYRERGTALPSPPDEMSRAPAPAAPSFPPVPEFAIPVATNTAAPNVYLMRPGITYTVQAEAELPEGTPLESIQRGLELGGAKKVSIVPASGGAAVLMRFEMTPASNHAVVLGEWIEVPGTGSRLRMIEVRPVVPTASPLLMPTLRRGSKGNDVAVLQRKLGIAADGKFGPGTHAAVVAYQRRNGLTPDGIVGPQTWVTLFGKAA